MHQHYKTEVRFDGSIKLDDNKNTNLTSSQKSLSVRVLEVHLPSTKNQNEPPISPEDACFCLALPSKYYQDMSNA